MTAEPSVGAERASDGRERVVADGEGAVDVVVGVGGAQEPVVPRVHDQAATRHSLANTIARS